jgi:Domain of unknown function (DUF1707)
MRASDADRERVAAILRRHYGAGRLDDDDLERRLARVLGARTLGQLRDQVADLPAPPPSAARRLAGGLLYAGRAVRHPVGIALSVLAALAVVGLIAGTTERRSESDSGSAASAPVPAPTATGTPYTYDPPAEHVTQVRTGSAATDDGVKFRVRRISRRSRMASGWENQPFLYPTPGHVFAVVTVDYTNKRSATVEPFCGGGGAKLYSTSHRGYELFERTYQATGNDALCGGGIEPQETSTAYLMFDVPRGAHFSFIDLYNGDPKGGDDLGNTRLRLHLTGFPAA